jgi:hypothetical protein
LIFLIFFFIAFKIEGAHGAAHTYHTRSFRKFMSVHPIVLNLSPLAGISRGAAQRPMPAASSGSDAAVALCSEMLASSPASAMN